MSPEPHCSDSHRVEVVGVITVASQVLNRTLTKIHLRLVLNTTRITQDEGGSNHIDWETNGCTGPRGSSHGVYLKTNSSSEKQLLEGTN